MSQQSFCKILLRPEEVKKVKEVKEAIQPLLSHISHFQALNSFRNCNAHTYFFAFNAPLCLTRKSARQGTAGLA
jgi:hypothetical protein